MRIALAVAISTLLVCACSMAPKEPVPITPKADVPGAAVSRRPVEPIPPLAAVAPSAAAAAIVVPPDTLYVCVSGTGGQQTQTSIAFDKKVGELCRRHPEMGPCQYERNICRRSGGRVYAANGAEITTQTEAEYDKKVMRVRFQAN